MNRYPRLPAILVLVVTVLVGLVYVMAWGDIDKFLSRRAGGSLQSLKAELDEYKNKNQPAPADLWHRYGNALTAAKSHSSAADAYRQALAMEGSNREMKFKYGLALALADRTEELFTFLKDMSVNDATLAVRLFDRTELQKLQEQDRFANLAREARNEAMD